MTPRSIRRAAERKAKKAALKANMFAPLSQDREAPDIRSYEMPAPESRPISAARLAANRANARLSTGPKRDEAKAKTCLNAVKTALTGRTVLLSSDDAVAYQKHVLAYVKELRPITQLECDLVQSIADTAWRLKRIPVLEMTLYAQGRVEFAESFNDRPASARPNLIELKTFLVYEKQIRNLELQEARLHRRYLTENAELRQLQEEREQAAEDDQLADSEEDGFEFATDETKPDFEDVEAATFTPEATLRSPESTHRAA